MTGEELLEKIECADPLYIMEADQDSAFFAELGKMRRIDERRRRNRAIRFLSAAAVFMLCFMLYEIFGFIQIEKKGNTYPRDTKQTDMQGNLCGVGRERDGCGIGQGDESYRPGEPCR